MEQKVWLTNIVGLILGAFYCFQFDRFCPKSANHLPGSKAQHKVLTAYIMVLTLVCAKILPSDKAIGFIGKMGVFFCILLYGSPLASLKDVIARKSAQSIPLPFTLACVMSSLLWSIFGVLEAKDFNIYFPNLLGLFLGIVQLAFLAIYGNGKSLSPQGGLKIKLPL